LAGGGGSIRHLRRDAQRSLPNGELHNSALVTQPPRLGEYGRTLLLVHHGGYKRVHGRRLAKGGRAEIWFQADVFSFHHGQRESKTASDLRTLRPKKGILKVLRLPRAPTKPGIIFCAPQSGIGTLDRDRGIFGYSLWTAV